MSETSAMTASMSQFVSNVARAPGGAGRGGFRSQQQPGRASVISWADEQPPLGSPGLIGELLAEEDSGGEDVPDPPTPAVPPSPRKPPTWSRRDTLMPYAIPDEEDEDDNEVGGSSRAEAMSMTLSQPRPTQRRLSLSAYGPIAPVSDEIIRRASCMGSSVGSLSKAPSPVFTRHIPEFLKRKFSTFTYPLDRTRHSRQLSLIRASELKSLEDDIIFRVLKFIEDLKARFIEKDRERTAMWEWKQLAYVLDRFVGYVYVVVSAVLWIGLFVAHHYHVYI